MSEIGYEQLDPISGDEDDVIILDANGIPISSGVSIDDVGGGFSGTMDDITDGATYVKTTNDYTDAEQSKLSGIEAGADVTDATNVAAAGAAMDGDFTSEGLMKRGETAGSYSIVTDNSGNWNSAYGWGDHASGGYAANGDLTSHTGNTSNPHSVTADQVLPSQTGNSGKFLTTNGITAGWGEVDSCVFELVSSVIRATTATGYANDFVIGSPQLDHYADVAYYGRFFYDKSQDYFFAGYVDSTSYIDGNRRGLHCANIGYRNKTGTATANQISYGYIVGNLNNVGLSGAVTDGYVFGKSNSLSAGARMCAFGYSNSIYGNFTYAYGSGITVNAASSMGYGNTTRIDKSGEYSFGLGQIFSGGNAGDFCYIIRALRYRTTDATATTLRDLNFNSYLDFADNRIYDLKGDLVAVQTGGTSGTVGDNVVWDIEVKIHKVGSTMSIVSSKIVRKAGYSAGAAAWSFALSISSDRLVVTVTGEADKTINWGWAPIGMVVGINF